MIHRVRRTVLVVSMLLAWVGSTVLFLHGHMLQRKSTVLAEDARGLERKSVQLHDAIPALQEAAQKVISRSGRDFGMGERGEAWCRDYLESLSPDDEFSLTITALKMAPPIGVMLDSWEKKNSGNNVFPGLVPYRVSLRVEGEIEDFAHYLEMLRFHRRGILVLRVNLMQNAESGLYSGIIDLGFPALLHEEQLARMAELATR